MPLIETLSKTWKPYLSRYEISDGGLIRCSQSSTNGTAGRMLLPSWSSGSVVYFIREGRGPSSRAKSITTLVKDVHGVKMKAMSREELNVLRDAITAYNGEKFPHIQRRGEKMKGQECFERVAESFACPFAAGQMKSRAFEVPDYSCAQVDPFGRYEDFQPAQPKGVAREVAA